MGHPDFVAERDLGATLSRGLTSKIFWMGCGKVKTEAFQSENQRRLLSCSSRALRGGED